MRRSHLTEKPNAQYNVASPDSLAIRVTMLMRRRMYDRFLAESRLTALESVIDVGVTSDRDYVSSNYLEAWYPHKHRITAVGMDDAGFLQSVYPGVRFVRADGRALPFPDNTFDVVHSSAVIEHVGSRLSQARFIAELYRVARRFVWITTPNRWFPVEVHTSIPLLHWLPVRMYRSVLRSLGMSFFAEEDNLNLLSTSELLALCDRLEAAKAKVIGVRLCGMTSNLMLMLAKRDGNEH